MLTDRQKQLLQAIIDEFVETAEAVGSQHLQRKYKLNLSPATIRNEMSDLVKQGYLTKPHSSSGRIPTVLGYKQSIQELKNKLDELDVELESVIKEELFQNRFDLDELIYNAINKINTESGNMSFAVVGGRIYYSGLSSVASCPEFADSLKLQHILHAVEDHDALKIILNKYSNEHNVRVLFGDDIGIDSFTDTALVYKLVNFHGDTSGFVGLIGPMRMNYAKNIALVDFIGESINEMLQSW